MLGRFANWVVEKTDPKDPVRLARYNRVWLYGILPIAAVLYGWKLVTGNWPWR